MSGFCKKALGSNGLNKPDCLKLFSTTFDISAPMSSSFNKSLNFSFDFWSTDNGDTANGSGFKLPEVI